jgi:hypothetical protein
MPNALSGPISTKPGIKQFSIHTSIFCSVKSFLLSCVHLPLAILLTDMMTLTCRFKEISGLFE